MKSNYLATSVLLVICAAAITAVAAGRVGIQSASAQTDIPGNEAPIMIWKKAPANVVKLATASIVAQLKAFKSNDYVRASTYQSAELKENFGTIDTFKTMMRASYPEFADYKSVAFGPIFSTPDQQMVQVAVKVIGADDVAVSAVYVMIKEAGLYRVAGVVGGVGEAPTALPADPTIS